VITLHRAEWYEARADRQGLTDKGGVLAGWTIPFPGVLTTRWRSCVRACVLHFGLRGVPFAVHWPAKMHRFCV
jgi:hypothetical protein